MKKRMMIMLLAVSLLLALVIGFHVIQKIMINKSMAAASQVPVAVSTIQAQKQEWHHYINVTGSTRAVQGVNVTTELPGMIQDIYFKPGQHVTRGDILVQLIVDDEIAKLESLIAMAELAEITYERDKGQYEAQAISKETLDTDEANLKSALAQVVQQEALVAKKTIRAPFNGKLGISQVNLGQFLNPGDEIVTLQTLDPIYVDFYIPEQELVHVNVGMPMNITTDAYKNKAFTGNITTINPIVDTDTRNIEIEATLPNPKGELLPGMYARVEVDIGEPEYYITIPQAAVSYNPYGNLVYLVKEEQGKKIVHQTFVTLGSTRGDQVAVLDGLKEGDEVVTSGQLKIKNGSFVSINNANPPGNNPNPVITDQ